MTYCYSCTSANLCTKCNSGYYLDSAQLGCFANCNLDTNSTFIFNFHFFFFFFFCKYNLLNVFLTEPHVYWRLWNTDELQCVTCNNETVNGLRFSYCDLCNNGTTCI